MKFLQAAFILFQVSLLAGCFTISESEFAKAEMSSVPQGSEKSIAVKGFDAVFTEYVTIYNQSVGYVPGFYGRRFYHPGYLQTYYSSSIVPQEKETDMFRVCATERFEVAGFNLKKTTPDYVVEVVFSGPHSIEEGLRCLGLVCSVFTFDIKERSYSAKLKIYDNKTGKLLFLREYVQAYEVSVFSPVPVVGVSWFDKTEESYMKSWCYFALTEKVTAEASAFLNSK
jgi:hypothetical protein